MNIDVIAQNKAVFKRYCHRFKMLQFFNRNKRSSCGNRKFENEKQGATRGDRKFEKGNQGATGGGQRY